MAISPNSKPTIYHNLYENTNPDTGALRNREDISGYKK